MYASKEILEDLDIAKSYITEADLDDESKKMLFKIVNSASLSINGIKIEEKIQRISESLFSLVIFQVIFMSKINKGLKKEIENALKNCETRAYFKKLSENKQSFPIEKKSKFNSSFDFLKQVFTRPYIYIFLSIAVFSPFLNDILKTILTLFNK